MKVKRINSISYLHILMLLTIMMAYIPSSSAQFGSVLDLSTLDGSNGFIIEGQQLQIALHERIARAIGSAGDINGDGFDDMMIGNPALAINGYRGTGIAHIVYGKSHFNKLVKVSEIDGTNGFSAKGIGMNIISGVGISVSAAGDFNGDGIDDFIIGSRTQSSQFNNNIIANIIFGNPNGFPSDFNLTEIEGSNGVKIIANEYHIATSITATDINADGISDIIIGGSSATGLIYVIYGSNQVLPSSINVNELNGHNGFSIEGLIGRLQVNNAGDVNGDGINDIILGANHIIVDGTELSEVFVVFGNRNGFGNVIDLGNLNGVNGFKIKAVNITDLTGNSVSSAGDINGDGIDDLLIGSKNASTQDGLVLGATYVLYGSSDNFPAEFELSDLDGNNGFTIHGISPFDFFGKSVSTLGDVNGDGVSDIIIGANGVNFNGINSGASYVIFGNSNGFSDTFSLLDINGENGFVINGINENDNLGIKVNSAGDVNGDGINDIFITSYSSKHFPSTICCTANFYSYVVFGKRKSVTIKNSHSALWYNSNQSGHGISVYMLANNGIVAIWYVYDDQGNQVWLSGVGTHDGVKATLDVTITDGAKPPPNFDSIDVNQKLWGQFELEFSSCNAGIFKWMPVSNNGFAAGEMDIVRLNNTLGLTCSETTEIEVNSRILEPPLKSTNEFTMQAAHSALWFNPEQSGHGINVYMLADNKIVVFWYVYNDQGKQVWLLGNGSYDGNVANLNVTIHDGGMFPPNFDSNDVNSTSWGSFQLEFSGCNAGNFKWFPESGNGFTSGEMSLVRLSNTSGLTCSE